MGALYTVGLIFGGIYTRKENCFNNLRGLYSRELIHGGRVGVGWGGGLFTEFYVT